MTSHGPCPCHGSRHVVNDEGHRGLWRRVWRGSRQRARTPEGGGHRAASVPLSADPARAARQSREDPEVHVRLHLWLRTRPRPATRRLPAAFSLPLKQPQAAAVTRHHSTHVT